MYGTDALVSVPSQGKESNNQRLRANWRMLRKSMFPSPLGVKSPTISEYAGKKYDGSLKFPSPLGVKSPTIRYDGLAC